MIYLSFSHLKSCYFMLLFSLIFIILIAVLKIILVYNRNPAVIKNILLFLFSLLGGLIFIMFTNLYNFGEYNFVLIICYIAIFNFADKRLKKLVDFFSLKLYYVYSIIFKWGKFYIAKRQASIQD